MLSYAEHGRSLAVAQERARPLFAIGKKGRKWRPSFWRRPLRLGFRNVLRHQWTTGCADAQGAKCVRQGRIERGE